MGDLCYYIHLREEHVMDRMRDMLVREEDIEVLHPPDMYFYLRELTKEDYIWFFDKVRKEGHTGKYFGEPEWALYQTWIYCAVLTGLFCWIRERIYV